MQGKQINGFELKRPLGVGGMAEVWYAENEIGMPVAVKILNDDLSRNAQIVERFRNEAMVMVKLSHQNITKVNGYGLIDGRQAIIMEYLEGNDLKSIMKSGRKFTDAELIKWWNQLVSALNYTHARGVVHRDIKPSNIFIDKDGDVKLMDFGIAKIDENGSGTQTGSTLGTRLYMSPEQVKDPKRVGPKSDNYSLAVSFVHLLTGKAPYDTTTSSDFDIQLQIVSKPLDMSGIPENWRNFLLPYLEKDPDKRAELKPFGEAAPNLATVVSEPKKTAMEQPSEKTVSGVAVGDETCVEEAPVSKTEIAQKPAKPKKSRKGLWIGISVAVVVVLVAVALTFVLWPKSYEEKANEALEKFESACMSGDKEGALRYAQDAYECIWLLMLENIDKVNNQRDLEKLETQTEYLRDKFDRLTKDGCITHEDWENIFQPLKKKYKRTYKDRRYNLPE